MFVRRVNGVRDWVSMNGLVVREAGIGLVALVNVEAAASRNRVDHATVLTSRGRVGG